MTALDPQALAAIRADAAAHHTRTVPYCTSCVDDIAQLCDEILRLQGALSALRSWADGAKVDIEGLQAEAEAALVLQRMQWKRAEAAEASRDQALAEVERLRAAAQLPVVTCACGSCGSNPTGPVVWRGTNKGEGP